MTDRTTQPRVLIMEDDYIIGLDMVEQAKLIGLEVDGPYATLADGKVAAREHKPDLAILDIELKDGRVFPLAETLTAQGVPIIFHTAHAGDKDLEARYPEARVCAKPCPPNIILDILAENRRAA